MAREGRFKRKDLDMDFVSDDFSLSPALKIRRLVMEDTESLLPMMGEEDGNAAPVPVVEMDESVPSPQSENLERALVLFRPINICTQSNYSVALDSQLLYSLKRDQLLSGGQPFEMIQSAENKISDGDERDGCKAVVPWVSRQRFQSEGSQDLMEQDEGGVVSMDVEDSEGNGNTEQMCQFYKTSLPQLQQHCLIPELPRSNPTPVIWLR